MKRIIIGLSLVTAMLLVGCTQKYVTIDLNDEALLVVHGDIDPEFMRENTRESISPEMDLSLPVSPKCTNECHTAYAMGSIPEEWQRQAEEMLKPKPEPIEPEVSPTPPVKPKPTEPKPEPTKPSVTTETLKIHSTRNPPYYQYYTGKPIASYPKEITVKTPNKSWVIKLTGRTRPGHEGTPGADHSPHYGRGDYIVKNSDVTGRGMTVLIHEKYGKNATIMVEY